MPEHIGVIEEAGFKPKKDPSKGNNFCMKVSGWERTYYINKNEDKHLQDKATELVGKRVKVTWELAGEYRNVSAIEPCVAPALNTPVSPSGEMTKEDWGLKDRRITRVAIAKSLIEAIGANENQSLLINRKDALELADLWFNWVYELSQNPATKPFPSPPMATKDKPAVAPPEMGAKTSAKLWDDMNTLMPKLKWGSARLKAEAVKLANANGWPNGELIAQNGIKELDPGQLTHLVALMQTESAQSASK